MAIRKTSNTDVIHATWEDTVVVTHDIIKQKCKVVQIKCSNCKRYSTDICRYGIPELEYCSRCGARMDDGVILNLSDEQERDDKAPTRADMMKVIEDFCDIFSQTNTCMDCKFVLYCKQLTWKEVPDSMISEIYKEILENEQR